MICLIVLATVLPVRAQDNFDHRLGEAEKIYREQGPSAALPLFIELADALESTGNDKAFARALGFVGELHWRTGDYPEAKRYLVRALQIKQEGDDRLEECKTLNVLGLLHWDLGDFEQAKAYFKKGSRIAEEMGDRRMAGVLMNNSTLVLDEEGDYYTALEQYQQVLELYRGENFPRGEGDTLGNIGGVYLLMGRFREALEHYQQSLAISEQLDSAISRSQDHGNIGLAYLGLGQVEKALSHLEEAVALSQATGMRQDEAYWLGAVGNAHLLRGRYDLALQQHRASLSIYQQSAGQTERVEALHDMGRLHLLLGDSGSAHDYFQQSLELARNVGISRRVTSNLVALGDLQFRLRSLDTAMSLYQQASERARESGEVVNWVDALLRESAVYREEGRFSVARETAAQAVKISREVGSPGLESVALFALAESFRVGADSHNALENFDRAIALLANSPDVEVAWRCHYGRGLALADLGRISEAIGALNTAVNFVEGVRDRLKEDRFRAGYIQDKYQVYVDLVRLQLEEGRGEDAFSTAERLRSRSFLDMLEPVSFDAGEISDDKSEFELKERIRTLRDALVEEQVQTSHEQRQLAINVYSQELLAAEQDYQAFIDDRHPTRRTSRAAPPNYNDVQAALLPGEALIEYVVGPKFLMLFLLNGDALITHTVPLQRDDLDNKVELLLNLVRRQDSERWLKPAASLGKLLLAPMIESGELQGVKQIYLVPHGTLNYLPFALLPGREGGRMVQDFTLVYLPTAAALLRHKRGAGSASGLLAMAPARTGLKHTGAEAEAVNALFDQRSTLLLGKSATESAFKDEAGQHRFLHLATHGYFNKFNPMLSGLELEPDAVNDGQLELHEIMGLTLDADLVTLSACQTALGGGHFYQVPAGDDFVGLTRAFLYAGSSSVLATLWEVDDASTRELMIDFYGRMVGSADESRAAALARAQRALLASEEFRHPYFWSPFVLVGASGGARSAKTRMVSVNTN